MHSLKLKGLKDWWVYCKSGKRPANIPASPHESYKDEWKGYPDWLGTKRIRPTSFLPFEEAREFARTLNIKKMIEWNIFAQSDKKPIDIPTNPA